MPTSAVKARYDQLVTEYAPWWPPTHPFAGTNTERAYVGNPGHCDYCAVLGHVVTHPDLGCGDVGCNRAHNEEENENA